MARAQRNPLQPLTQTGQWIKAGVGLGAALATSLASAHSCGVIGDDSSRFAVANLAVSWIGVAPGSDTATAIGDTLRFVATVTDRRGAALAGAGIDWSTDDPTVATVDSAGFVIARRAGATHVVAKVRDRIARAHVIVRPQVAHLDFGADSVLRVPEAGRVPLALRALDARGHRLARARAALTARDTSIAALDSVGAVVGLSAGRTVVAASLDGVTDSIAVEVIPVPGRVVVVRGADQHAAAATPLPEPVLVRVESRRGRPIAGAVVRFSAWEGGAVRPDSAATDADGLARGRWTLGDAPGRQALVAEVYGLDSALAVYAEAEPLAANTRIAASGDPEQGLAGQMLPVQTVVRVTDSLGRVLPGVPVAWIALDGGSIEALGARTDQLGESRAEWRLGPRAGPQHARVLVGSGRSVPGYTVTALALPGYAVALQAIGTRRLAGVVGRPLERPVVARVTDSLGNPVPDVPVVASVTAGDVDPASATSDSAGRVAFRWTLGQRAGDQSLTLAAPHVAPLELAASARPRPADSIAFVARAPAGPRAGGQPVRVLVTDEYGNPVPRQAVTFGAVGGTVRPMRATTGGDGTAAATWVVQRTPGTHSLVAKVAAAVARLEVTTAPPKALARGAAPPKRK
jgi:hypothetical protein